MSIKVKKIKIFNYSCFFFKIGNLSKRGGIRMEGYKLMPEH